jgi:hypothetical protein
LKKAEKKRRNTSNIALTLSNSSLYSVHSLLASSHCVIACCLASSYYKKSIKEREKTLKNERQGRGWREGEDTARKREL